MKRTIISVLVVILALAGIVYVVRANKADNEAIAATVARKNSKVTVKVVEAALGKTQLENPVNGIFIPERDVDISTETPGRVTRVLVKEGDRVSAGQLLAVIKADQQTVNASNAEVVYQNALSELRRYEEAYASGGVTQQQVQQKKLELENAKSNLKSAQINISDVNVRASFPGVINQRNIEPGSYANPGQVLFDIVDVSSLKLRINVDEKNIASIHLGQEIGVEASAIPDKSWTGKVSFIAPRADGNLTFPVELRITNPGNDLKAGMYGTANIGTKNGSENIVIPVDAFVGSISSNEVYIARGDRAILTKVSSGKLSGNNIEILSGIQAGDKVITAGQINLTDSAAIQIIQ